MPERATRATNGARDGDAGRPDPVRRGYGAVTKQFLFLQGPHGPFFRRLARLLRAEGAGALKVGISRADDREWGGAGPYQPFTGVIGEFDSWLRALIRERGVTDIVLYGDTRPHHAAALKVATDLGLTSHCFEEGYLRPYWVTYERGGTNGYSRLMDFTVAEMAEASRIADLDLEDAPPIWGAAWRHAFHGFRHHADVLFLNRAYPNYAPHRQTGLGRELALYLKRLLVLPLLFPVRRLRERRLLRSGRAYHLVLLQMAVDASMRHHSGFRSVGAFVDHCLEAFAMAAPPDHAIAFKAHPFEDGRERLERHAKRTAARLGIADRMIFLQGGKLGPLLDRARSAVTINSTAGQQALWRGLPLSVSGDAVYNKPEFTRADDLAAFFARPDAPDAVAYREYRQFLLMTSQLRGGFYSRAGRELAATAAVAKMLDPLDPYDRLFHMADVARRGEGRGASIAVFPRRA